MKSVEDAYQNIGLALSQAANHSWTELVLQTKILENNCSAMRTEQVSSNATKCDLELDFSSVFETNDACVFLRDDLLKTTGQRIWGLTFTLYPNGKFSIEYDYDKPEGYEESDELMSGEEINRSLGELGVTDGGRNKK